MRISTRALAVGRHRITVRVGNANGISRAAHAYLRVRARPAPPFTG